MADEENNEDFNIDKLLKRLTETEFEDQNEAQKELQTDTLVSKIEEYMSPFIIFGYDVNGNCVVLNNSKNQRDMDGLTLSIGRYMSMHSTGSHNGGIGDMMDD